MQENFYILRNKFALDPCNRDPKRSMNLGYDDLPSPLPNVASITMQVVTFEDGFRGKGVNQAKQSYLHEN